VDGQIGVRFIVLSGKERKSLEAFNFRGNILERTDDVRLESLFLFFKCKCVELYQFINLPLGGYPRFNRSLYFF
jgi:hypothetical protein